MTTNLSSDNAAGTENLGFRVSGSWIPSCSRSAITGTTLPEAAILAAMAARSWNEYRLLNLLLTSKVFFLELALKLCLQSLRPLGICRKKSSAMSFCPPSPLPLSSVSSRSTGPRSFASVSRRSSLLVLRPSSSPCPPRSWTSIGGGSLCKVFACCHMRFWAGASWARSLLLPPRLKCAPAGATTQTKFDSEQHELSSMTASMHMFKAHVICFKPPHDPRIPALHPSWQS